MGKSEQKNTRVNGLRFSLLLAMAAITGAPGCLSEEDAALNEADEADEAEAEIGTTSQALVASQKWVGPETERSVSCDANDVMVGGGGRVDSNKNFTDLVVYCRRMLANGTLATGEPNVRWDGRGGRVEEVRWIVPQDRVVVGVGGTVTNHNLVRIVFRACLWDSATRSVNWSQCKLYSNHGESTLFDANTSAEMFAYANFTFGEANMPKTVMTGFGMSANSSDNMGGLKIKVGLAP